MKVEGLCKPLAPREAINETNVTAEDVTAIWLDVINDMADLEKYELPKDVFRAKKAGLRDRLRDCRAQLQKLDSRVSML